ncbi:MAG: YncE family protein [Flavipsychrobacter sp.]
MLLVSCVKDKPANPITMGTGNVYVVCEGSLGNGDGTLYAYNPKLDSAYGDKYYAVNKQPLGDVFQSMQRIGDNLFLCVNNSDKVMVVDASSLQLKGIINIPKPRYILKISSTKAYVSTLFSNKVYIINPQSLQVTGVIAMPYQNTEGMILYNNKAFICTWDTAANHLYAVDVATDKVTDSILLAGYAPQEIMMDREYKLWVLSGNMPKSKACVFNRIDPDNDKLIKSYAFAIQADPVRPVMNRSNDSIYFIEADFNGGTQYNGIFRMSIYDAALPTVPFIAAKRYQYFWALGIDPATGYIYVGDPKGFIQKGTVSVYKSDASLVSQFNVGIGPGHFYFDE